MRATHLFVAALGFCVPMGAVSAEANRIDPDWLGRLKTEGRAAHDKYVEVGKSIEGEYEWRSFKTAGGGASRAFTPATRQYRFSRVEENHLLEEVRTFEGEANQTQISLQGWNRDYLFKLSKVRPDAPYALADYQTRSSKNQGSEPSGLPAQAYSGLAMCLDASGGGEKSTLKSLGLDRERSSLLLVRIVTAVDNGVRTNDYWLDPGRSWRVVEARVETPTLIATTSLQYGREVGGVEFPTRSLHSTKYKGTGSEFPPNFDIESTLKSLSRCNKTDADFRLTAFGLPEPVDAPPAPSRSPRYLWFVAAAVGFAALAIVFRLLTRRRNPPAAPEGTA